MRIGIAQWCYQWFLAEPNGPYFCSRDSVTYDQRGLPKPYFAANPRHVSQATPSDPLEWLLTRCGELGADVAHCHIDRWDDPCYLDRLKEFLARHSLELIPVVGADIVCTGDRAKRGQEEAIAAIERYRGFGGVRTIKFNPPMTHNRFSKEIPVAKQIALITANVRPIVAAAEEAGIVLALENHYDYRASEILSVIEAVRSPALRSLLDVGSPFAVCEEPVEAARLLAPYVALVHVKDVRVLPWTPASPGYHACQYATPLGEGNVDLHAILEILKANAPDPDSLCLALETVPAPPQDDEDRWVVEGVAWLRRAGVTGEPRRDSAAVPEP